MRKGMALVLALLVMLPLTVTAIAGCGEKSNAEAEALLNQDLEDLKVSLAGMLDPNIYTSSDLFKNAWKQVENAYNGVVDSAKEVKDARVTDLTTAFSDLKKAIGNVTGTQSLVEKADAITTALEELQNAWQQLFSDINPGK